jgi:hypothetical protein
MMVLSVRFTATDISGGDSRKSGFKQDFIEGYYNYNIDRLIDGLNEGWVYEPWGG